MKRTFSVGLTMLVLIGVLVSGCAAPTGTGQTGGAAAQATTAPAVQPTTAAAEQPTTAPASGGAFDWKKYSGSTIRVMLNQHPWTTAVQPSIPEFEALTGIKVVLETYPEDQFRQKSLVELTSGAGTLDIFMSQPPQEGLKYKQAGWYEDLTSYVNDPAQVSSDYKFDDFLPGTITFETIEGVLIGIPIQLEVEMLFYRKDLLEAAGLTPPKTLEELQAAAQKLDSADGSVFGIASRGKKAAAVTMFSNYLYNHGGNWLTENREPAINSPEAVEALTYYGNLLKEYGPPGSVNNHWNEVVALFQQGKAAMFTDASVFFANVENPEASTVSGKVGYAPFPAGPKGNEYWLSGWGLSMASSSKNKGPAWYFIQWATSPEIARKTQIEGKVAGPRQSVWDATGTDVFPQDWMDAFVLSSSKATRPDRPPVVAVSEVRDAIGNAIVAAIEGQDVKAAADKAAADMKDIMAKTETQ